MEAALDQMGLEYSAVYSEYPGHASHLTKQALAGEYGCIVATGGDGTVREVAQELIHTGVPLGILPFGTGNDIIRSLGIPREPEAALAHLLEGSVRAIDTMEVNGSLCLNVAGFGFDVEVLRKTQRYKAHVHGTFAYILGALTALVRLHPYHVRITTDKGVLEEDVLMVTVGNGACIGGGMRVAPLADIGDGLLDLCVLQRAGAPRTLVGLVRLMGGGHLGMKTVRYHQTRAVEIVCEPDAPIQLDGEIIQSTPAAFRINPASLHIVAREEPLWKKAQ